MRNHRIQNQRIRNHKSNSKTHDENNYKNEHDFSSMNKPKSGEKVLGIEWDKNKDILRLRSK